MENCVFCKIITGEIPSFKVLEDEDNLAFLSIHPIAPGHTLVIPKKHHKYIFEMDSQSLAKLMDFSKPVAFALSRAFQPKTGRVGIMVAGLEVPHVHLHLIPMNSQLDLDFKKARTDATPDQLKEDQRKIKAAL